MGKQGPCYHCGVTSEFLFLQFRFDYEFFCMKDIHLFCFVSGWDAIFFFLGENDLITCFSFNNYWRDSAKTFMYSRTYKMSILEIMLLFNNMYLVCLLINDLKSNTWVLVNGFRQAFSVDLGIWVSLLWFSALLCLKFKTLRCLVNIRSLSLPAYEFGVWICCLSHNSQSFSLRILLTLCYCNWNRHTSVEKWPTWEASVVQCVWISLENKGITCELHSTSLSCWWWREQGWSEVPKNEEHLCE